MGPTHESGIPGLRVQPGEHICAIYRNREERDDVMLPFLREGLRSGDKCICLVRSTPSSDVLADLCDACEVDDCVASGQLEVLSSREADRRPDPFSTNEMLARWETSVGAAMKSGRFSFARLTGEMPPPANDLVDREQLFRSESELERFASRYPQIVLSLYDLNDFGGGIVIDLLKTHPKVLLANQVLESLHWVSPDELPL